MADDDPDPTIVRPYGVLFDAIDEFAGDNRLTTGQAMGALFSAFVESAKKSPQYDPKQLVADVDARIREAVGLQ